MNLQKSWFLLVLPSWNDFLTLLKTSSIMLRVKETHWRGGDRENKYRGGNSTWMLCSYFSAKGSTQTPKKGSRHTPKKVPSKSPRPSFSSGTCTSPWIPWLFPSPTHTWLPLNQHFWNFPSAQLKIPARALMAAVASTSPGLVLIHPGSLCWAPSPVPKLQRSFS